VTDIETAAWRAIGTGIRLVVSGGDLASARQAVEGVLDEVDRTYSRFRADSEISRLNAGAGSRTTVSPLLAEAIEAGLRAARLTDGAVDPTVGSAMRAIGYDADFAQVPNKAGPIELRLQPIPGWQVIDVAARRSEVAIPRGVELDLGSIGKALAADLAATVALVAAGSGGVLVSLGGDIAVRGTAPIGGWRILVAEDSETSHDSAGEVVAIETGAIATSSTTVRRWQRGRRTLHHLVDPRTGGPVDSRWRTASVVAATCVDANTAATAAIVMGDAAVGWLETTGLAARLVDVEGSILRVGGWPELPGENQRPVIGSNGAPVDHRVEPVERRPKQPDGAPSP
jgi:thiamine biosynthesis lipoprotein